MYDLKSILIKDTTREAVGVYESKIIRYNPNKSISHIVHEDKNALHTKVFGKNCIILSSIKLIITMTASVFLLLKNDIGGIPASNICDGAPLHYLYLGDSAGM